MTVAPRVSGLEPRGLDYTYHKMAGTRIVLAQGVIDGSNRVFSAGEPYVPGSTSYILNGRIHNLRLARGADNDYGYVELDPAAGTIEVDVAPLVDDIVQILFQDRRATTIPVVTRMTGVVSAKQPAEGVIRDPAPDRIVGIIKGKCS